MAPRSVQSWVDGVHRTTLRPTLMEDKKTAAAADYDGEEKEWKVFGARTEFGGSNSTTQATHESERTKKHKQGNREKDDPWTTLASHNAVGDSSRISRLTAPDWESDLTPERLRPSKSDPWQLSQQETHQLSLDGSCWLCTNFKNSSRHKRGDSHNSYTSHQSEKQARFVSMAPISPGQADTSSFIMPLQPSDVAYPISWLISAYSSNSRCSKRHLETPLSPFYSKFFTNTKNHIDHDISPKEFGTFEQPHQPAKSKTSLDDLQPCNPTRRRIDTLSPEDSISVCSLRQLVEAPDPVVAHPLPMAHRFAAIHSDTISYCPSQSTHAYVYQRPDAVVTRTRVSTPPLIKAYRGGQKLDEPLRDTATPSLRFPSFASPPPIYDPHMGPIRSIPLEKLPPGYQTKPQNGRIAWLHAITGLLIVFNCWGINNAFGLFQEYYETVHLPGSSPSTIAWIGSTQLALVFALGVPVGKLVDKGHFRLVFHTGTVIMLVGIFCTAWCTKFWQLFLVQGLITGLGMGMVFCSGVVALMTWFDEMHVGMAMGVAAAGSAIGGIAYVLLARHLLRTMGFATTMRILGGVAAVAMVPPSLVYRMRDQKHKHLRRFQRASRASPIQFGSFESSAMMPMPVTMPPRTGWRTFVQPEYLLAGAGMSLAFLGVYFPFVFIISYGSTELDLSQKASTNLLIYMLSASLPGRFVPALISDRCIGPLNTVIPSVLLSSAVIGLWAASQQNEVSLIVLACFYGFVSAGVQVLYAPTVHALCMEPKPTRAPFDELNSHMNHGLATDRLGLKAGGIFIFIGIACLVGTPIGGALIRYSTDMGISQPFLAGQIFAAVSLLLSGVLLLASRTAKAGWTARRT